MTNQTATRTGSETMQPTPQQCEDLAKVFQIGQTDDADGWEDLYLDADATVATLDTLDDFRQAARTQWAESSTCEDIDGGLYWERIQIGKGHDRVALAVIDCGDFRLSYRQ